MGYTVKNDELILVFASRVRYEVDDDNVFPVNSIWEYWDQGVVTLPEDRPEAIKKRFKELDLDIKLCDVDIDHIDNNSIWYIQWPVGVGKLIFKNLWDKVLEVAKQPNADVVYPAFLRDIMVPLACAIDDITEDLDGTFSKMVKVELDRAPDFFKGLGEVEKVSDRDEDGE